MPYYDIRPLSGHSNTPLGEKFASEGGMVILPPVNLTMNPKITNSPTVVTGREAIPVFFPNRGYRVPVSRKEIRLPTKYEMPREVPFVPVQPTDKGGYYRPYPVIPTAQPAFPPVLPPPPPIVTPIPSEVPSGQPVPPPPPPPPPGGAGGCPPGTVRVWVGNGPGRAACWPNCTPKCVPFGQPYESCRVCGGGGGGGSPGGGRTDGQDCWPLYAMPGVIDCDCRCNELQQPNSHNGWLTRMVEIWSLLLVNNDRALQEQLNEWVSFGRDRGFGEHILKNYKAGLCASIYARDWRLCWPLQARDYIQGGGPYVEGGSRAAAAVLGAVALSEMAATMPAAAPGVAQWPVAFSKCFLPHLVGQSTTSGPASEELYGGLSVANNLIAQAVTEMRFFENRVERARATASICRDRVGAGAGSEPLSGYRQSRVLNLGAIDQGCPRDADGFMLYYLTRFPAIKAMLGPNPQGFGATGAANQINANLTEVLVYTRELRTELLLLDQIIAQCEQGFGSPLPPPPTNPLPVPPGSDVFVDPNGSPTSLPNPHVDPETFEPPVTGPPPAFEEQVPTPVQVEPAGKGSLLLLALIGGAAALASRR